MLLKQLRDKARLLPLDNPKRQQALDVANTLDIAIRTYHNGDPYDFTALATVNGFAALANTILLSLPDPAPPTGSPSVSEPERLVA